MTYTDKENTQGSEETPGKPNRRGFFRQVSAVAISAGAGRAFAQPVAAVAPDERVKNAAFATLKSIRLTVNGTEHILNVEPRVTLLDALRETLHLTGAKKGCNRGECGACTVLMEGRRVNACLVLAVSAESRSITTVEGLAQGELLHPVQRAFIAHDAFQCGFCTSGQIMSAVACIREGHTTSNAEIREWMSGNLCRCAAYPQIAEAVAAAAKEVA